MKKKLFYLCGVFFLMSVVSAGVIRLAEGTRGRTEDKDVFLIVTSFYPVYLIARNVTDEVPGVEVRNLTENHAGCIHDYQLTTEDMRLLMNADLFILNGGGMEAFVEQAAGIRADLTTAEALRGIALTDLVSEHNHDHENSNSHEHEDHEGGAEHGSSDDLAHSHPTEGNAHVWMDPERYQRMIRNVADALCESDPANEALYHQNAERYCKEVRIVEGELAALRKQTQGIPVVLFHDAFVYLAEALGMEILHTASLDEDTTISAGELAEMIEEMRHHHGRMIWEESDVNNPAGERLAAETGGSLYGLNPLVSGDHADSLRAYIEGMRQNIAVIKEALE